MAIYRQIWINFWTDAKIDDDFTPEDKYFYLYLLTNPHTNLCGCYEISMKQMAKETGYNEDTIKRLLERMKSVHGVIDYDLSTKEVLILNWHKYNWSNSDKLIKGVVKVASEIKSELFKKIILSNIKKCQNGDFLDNEDTLSIGYEYPMHTTVTDSISDSLSSKGLKDLIRDKDIKEIIDYLNLKCNKKYTYKNKSYNSKINARLKEGFTVDDFKTVIDKKCDGWLGTEFEQYLTPDTLFAPSKFEKYLNQTLTKTMSKGEIQLNETKDALSEFLGQGIE